jgi:hypothetical protein
VEHLLYALAVIHDDDKGTLLLPAVADSAEYHPGLLMADLWSPVQFWCD